MARKIEHPAVLAVAVALCVGAGAAAAAEPSKKPVIKISRETTYLTSPLGKDGRVDYLAALNARYGKGVTPQNNAFVAIIEALGPKRLGEETRPALFKALGVTLPAGKQFPELPSVPRTACWAPWQKTDSPEHAELANWLHTNGRIVDLLVKASRQSRYFVPCVPAKGDAALWNSDLAAIGTLKLDVQRLIVARAGMRIARGETGAAVADIRAALRIGALHEQGPLMIDRLVGSATAGVASKMAIALTKSVSLSTRQAREILSTIDQLPPARSLVEIVDVGERYFILDYTVALAGGHIHDAYFQQFVTLANLLKETDPSQAEVKVWVYFVVSVLMSRKHMDQVDWTAMLKACNTDLAELVKILRLPTFAARKNAFRLYDARVKLGVSQVKAAWRKMGKPASAAKVPPSAVNAAWIAGACSSLSPWVSPTFPLELLDVLTADQGLAKLAVALAGYRAEHGSYPRRLSLLKPQWLKTLPKDVCSGKGFVYKRRGKGYVLYSVGRNMRDDGGQERPEDAGADYNGPDDIVVRVGTK